MTTDDHLRAVTAAGRCPCGTGAAYSVCCGAVHHGAPAVSAEALMRSRYTAFALGLVDYLRASWHPSTRPRTIDLDGTRWRRLQIVDRVRGGEADADGIVEFRASYLHPEGGVGVVHERSRFTRVDGAWLYLDGDVLQA